MYYDRSRCVVEAVSRINSSKHDIRLGLSSDHVKHECHELSFVYVVHRPYRSWLYNGRSIVEHSILPISKGKT